MQLLNLQRLLLITPAGTEAALGLGLGPGPDGASGFPEKLSLDRQHL